MKSGNKSTKDSMSNEHDKKNVVLEKKDNQSMNIILSNNSLGNHKRYVGQLLEFYTPTSTNQMSNEFDHKMESSLTNNENSSTGKKVSLNLNWFHPHVHHVIIHLSWILGILNLQ